MIKEFTSEDYPTLCGWWEKHGVPRVPEIVFLPGIGYIAEQAACAFLFVCPNPQGGVGLIEFTTTNPEKPAKVRLQAVKSVYAALEKRAWEIGCGSLLALVGVNSSEQHQMSKVGFENMGGTPHLIYGKARSWPSPS